MKYWDTSALVPLIAREDSSKALVRLRENDLSIATWWGSLVECHSAIDRRFREQAISEQQRNVIRRDLARLWGTVYEVRPTEALRSTAIELLHAYTLRAADAFQLAAWRELTRSGGRPGFVTLDQRLASAAEAEGADVLRS